MEFIVETKALNYCFKRNQAILKNLSIQVPKGAIYGFLGPNGAGKTTSLRILLGLLKHSDGLVTVFGKDHLKHRVANLQKMGSLIEQPSLYLHLSGRENLEIYRRIFSLEKSRVDEVLELVDLASAQKKKAKAYSLGMKQRLSIAIALLHNPELLILDEPTNGLDPSGIIDMRNLLVKLNKEQGITIIISSHILVEVERIITHLGIIREGELVFQGSKEALGKITKEKSKHFLRTDENEKVQSFLHQKGFISEKLDNILILPFENDEQTANINALLIQNGFKIFESSCQNMDLEKVFLQLTA